MDDLPDEIDLSHEHVQDHRARNRAPRLNLSKQKRVFVGGNLGCIRRAAKVTLPKVEFNEGVRGTQCNPSKETE